MKYARLINNVVAETFTPPTDFAIEECFTPQVVAQFEPCPEEVEPQWLKQADGTFVPPTPPVEPEPLGA